MEVSPKMIQLQSQALTGSTTPDDTVAEYQSQKTKFGPDVHWHRFLDQVPKERSCFIAHEFFDVLPIYKFQVSTSLSIADIYVVLIFITNDSKNVIIQ